MTATVGGTTALGDNAARQLANATKSVPQLETITPRWLTHLLQWVPVDGSLLSIRWAIAVTMSMSFAKFSCSNEIS